MFGGELIATGSSSCIFKPNIPCKSSDKISNERISKIVYSEDAIFESKNEKKMNDKIQKIKGYSKWSLIFNEYCKPMKKDILENYDSNGINDCFSEEEERYLIDDFDLNSYMMNGNYGGITLNEYFENVFYNKISNNKSFSNEFYDLMRRIEPLFLGLKVMYDNKIVHNDIKYNNIVMHNGVFKFIDFGLSEYSSNKNHFKDRSLSEFNTERLYLFYPLDYLLFYANKTKINQEINLVSKGYTRRNFFELDEVLKLFNTNGLNNYLFIQDLFQNKQFTEIDMIKSIDTYSLGILIPLLFLFNTKSKENSSPSSDFIQKILSKNIMVQEFFELFLMMLNISPKNRIKPEYAYKEFKRLLKKFKNKKHLDKKSLKRKSLKRKSIKRKSLKRKQSRKRNIIGRVNKRRLT
jgi:serine/threonine protein kinase